MKRFAFIIVLAILSAGMQAEKKDYPTQMVNGQLCYVYKAEKSIGLYRISVNFGCTQEEILEFNPELRTRGLQLDETLYIPVRDEAQEVQRAGDIPTGDSPAGISATLDAPSGGQSPVGSPAAVNENENEDENEDENKKEDNKIRIGLLMPLFAHEANRQPSIEKFTDFYEGVLIATYELHRKGVPVELDVFDVEKGNTIIENLIHQGKLSHLNAILGPAYPSQVNALANYVEAKHIPTLIPLTDKISQIGSNPYLIQFNVSAEDEAKLLVDTLAADTMVNVVLVDARESDIPESIRLIRAAIRERGIRYTMTSVKEILSDSLQKALLPDKVNVILLNSERYSNISVLIPKIEQAQIGNRIELISQYAWPREKISVPQIYLTEFGTPDSVATAHYDALYERYFRHEHNTSNPRFDLLGYDLMHALVARLKERNYTGLQSTLKWRRIPGGGVKNTELVVVRE